MRLKMHAILGIYSSIGHADVFLTMSGNPNRLEIKEALFPGLNP